MKKTIFKILAATLWISLSEFFRNEVLLKSYWEAHYASMGLMFPSEPVNGIVWGVWSLMLAIAIYFISTKFPFPETIVLSWFVGFVLMWLVIWNMGVFPVKLVMVAGPLSLLEVFVASLIITGRRSKNLKKENPIV